MARSLWIGFLALTVLLSTAVPALADVPSPRRNGPFRSCGSGAGTGLAAIGISWTVLWLGTRLAGRMRGTKEQPPR